MQKKPIYLILLIASMVVNVMLGFIYYRGVTNSAMLQTELAKLRGETTTEVVGEIREAALEESARLSAYELVPDRFYVFGTDIPIGTYGMEVKYPAQEIFAYMYDNSAKNCAGGSKAYPSDTDSHSIKLHAYGEGATLIIRGNPELVKLIRVSDHVPDDEPEACDAYYG